MYKELGSFNGTVNDTSLHKMSLLLACQPILQNSFDESH